MNLPSLGRDDRPDAPWVVASSEPWPGEVAVYSSLDGASWSFNALLGRRAMMGTTQNTLLPATPGLWDRGLGLDVAFVSGALASVDDVALFAGANAAVIGGPGRDWEIFQFRDAALISPDTWRLSMRLRGQRGTEASMGSGWPAGSTVVILDGSALQASVPTELRDVPIRYRVGPASKPVDHGAYVEFEHTTTALGLRPYAPVRLEAISDGVGGFDFYWLRRTRINGDSWALPEVPLGEASEAYQVRVKSQGEVVREETVIAPTWAYSATDIVSDGVTMPFEIEVAQISDLYGPGDIARIVING